MWCYKLISRIPRLCRFPNGQRSIDDINLTYIIQRNIYERLPYVAGICTCCIAVTRHFSLSRTQANGIEWVSVDLSTNCFFFKCWHSSLSPVQHSNHKFITNIAVLPFTRAPFFPAWFTFYWRPVFLLLVLFYKLYNKSSEGDNLLITASMYLLLLPINFSVYVMICDGCGFFSCFNEQHVDHSICV